MDIENFSIKIASDTSRDHVFAEIYYKNKQWAEISIETDEPLLALFPPMGQKFWEFSLDEGLQSLEMAKKALIN